MTRTYYVYILASRRNGTLYIGITGDLARRMWEHREGLIEGSTKKYGVKKLVHFEAFGNVRDAIHRETPVKKWKEEWKINLIQQTNLKWDDLYDNVVR